jgi:hypothetical protein
MLHLELYRKHELHIPVSIWPVDDNTTAITFDDNYPIAREIEHWSARVRIHEGSKLDDMIMKHLGTQYGAP